MIEEMYVVLKLRKSTFTRFIADLLGISGSSLMFRDHTQKRHIREDSSGQAIEPSQRPLPDNGHNIHKQQTFAPPTGLEPAIPAGKRPQSPHLTPHGHCDRQSHKLW